MPRRVEPVLWSVDKAAQEFKINPRTLLTRLKQNGSEPCYTGDNGKVKRFFSTQQIAEAVFGSLERERIRETAENADRLAIANARTRGELVTTDSVFGILENMFVAIRQVIKQSGLSDIEKHECLKQLREIKVSDLVETEET